MALNCHVHVICHPAIGVQAMSVLVEAIFDQRLPFLPIIGIKKYGLPVVATQNDVVQTTGYVKSRFPGHAPV